MTDANATGAGPALDAQLGITLGVQLYSDLAAGTPPDAEQASEAVRLLARARRDLRPDDPLLVTVRYWLATVFLIQFACYAGSNADAQVALAELGSVVTEPRLDPDLAGQCHLFIAYLLLARAAPETIRRRATTLTPEKLGHLIAAGCGRPSPDDARTALGHLDQVPGTPQFATMAAWLRTAANLALGTPLRADAGPPVTLLEGLLRETPDDDPSAGELRAMLGLLQTVAAGQQAGGGLPREAAETLATAAGQLGESHPMLPALRSILGGAFGLSPTGKFPAPADIAAAVDLLAATLDGMPDDHPGRAEVLIRLGGLLMMQTLTSDRSASNLERLRRQLEKGMARPAPDQQIDAINHLLLGMTEGIQALFGNDAELFRTALERLRHVADAGAPVDRRFRDMARAGLSALLSQRYAQQGGLESLDAAMDYVGQLTGHTGHTGQGGGDEATSDLALTARYLRIIAPAIRNPAELDRDHLDRMIAEIEALNASVPLSHPLRIRCSVTSARSRCWPVPSAPAASRPGEAIRRGSPRQPMRPSRPPGPPRGKIRSTR